MKSNLAACSMAAIHALDSQQSVAASRSLAQTECISLPREKVIRLEKNSGIKSVETKSGMVWVTGTPANGDVLLSPGARFELRDNWPFVIQALEPVELFMFRTFEL